MTRIYRSWACSCCGYEWTRTRGETTTWITCTVCEDRQLVAARTPRQRRQCRHRRVRQQYHAAVDRLGRLPRTRSGLALRPSAGVRAAWRAVRAARTRPALERRATAFVAALLAQTRDGYAPDGSVARWTRIPRIDRDGHFTVRKRAGGVDSMPTVRIAPVREIGRSTLGDWRQALLRGVHEIRLQDGRSLDEMRRTLVHEVLHQMDSDAHIKGDHDHLWTRRLARMEQLFPCQERRTRSKRLRRVAR